LVVVITGPHTDLALAVRKIRLKVRSQVVIMAHGRGERHAAAARQSPPMEYLGDAEAAEVFASASRSTSFDGPSEVELHSAFAQKVNGPACPAPT
jgi:hypothetical protein